MDHRNLACGLPPLRGRPRDVVFADQIRFWRIGKSVQCISTMRQFDFADFWIKTLCIPDREFAKYLSEIAEIDDLIADARVALNAEIAIESLKRGCSSDEIEPSDEIVSIISDLQEQHKNKRMILREMGVL